MKRKINGLFYFLLIILKPSFIWAEVQRVELVLDLDNAYDYGYLVFRNHAGITLGGGQDTEFSMFHIFDKPQDQSSISTDLDNQTNVFSSDLVIEESTQDNHDEVKHEEIKQESSSSLKSKPGMQSPLRVSDVSSKKKKESRHSKMNVQKIYEQFPKIELTISNDKLLSAWQLFANKQILITPVFLSHPEYTEAISEESDLPARRSYLCTLHVQDGKSMNYVQKLQLTKDCEVMNRGAVTASKLFGTVY